MKEEKEFTPHATGNKSFIIRGAIKTMGDASGKDKLFKLIDECGCSSFDRHNLKIAVEEYSEKEYAEKDAEIERLKKHLKGFLDGEKII